MTAPKPGAYQVGGTLGLGHWSYISRRVDDEIFEKVLEGTYLFVLTARTMGKSSLMVRVVEKARATGARCACLDCSNFGSGWDANHFYPLLIEEIGNQLGDRSRQTPPRTGTPPSRQFFEWIRTLVRHSEGRLIVFLDEIDFLRGTSVAPDFFAIIRSCFNQRAQQPEFDKISFVLLGAATPSQIINDPDRTPFNIGERVALPDFTRAEVDPLAKYLHPDAGIAAKFLDSVHSWTGGQPFLTQALCRAIASQAVSSVRSGNEDQFIDGLMKQQFLTAAALRNDENLKDIRAKLVTTPGLLQLYEHVRRGEPVRDEHATELHSLLKLSGIVKVNSLGFFEVRNRLYREAFSPEWIEREAKQDLLRNRGGERIIGVVVVSLMGYAADLIASIERELRERGARMVVLAGGVVGEPSGCAERFYQRLAPAFDGLIVLSGTLRADAQQITQFCDQLRPTPLVSIAMAISRVPSVLSDNAHGIQLAMDHLKNHGCRRIAFLAGPETNEDARARLQAYRDYVAREDSVDDDPELVWPGTFDPESGRLAARAAATRKARFDGLLAANDAMAAAAQSELQERGIKVPIIGFDDTDAALWASPLLTTVAQPFDRLGAAAVALLWTQLTGESSPDLATTLDVSRLVIRESCTCKLEKIAHPLDGGNLEGALGKTLKQLGVGDEPARPLAAAYLEFERTSKTGDPNAGQRFLESLLRALPLAGASTARPWGGTGLLAWHYALQILRHYINPDPRREDHHRLKTYDGRMLEDDSIRQQRAKAEMLSHDANREFWAFERRHRLKQELEAARRVRVLSELSSAILTTVDLERVMDIIARKLPELDVKDCFICHYDDSFESAATQLPSVGAKDQTVRVLLSMRGGAVRTRPEESVAARLLVRSMALETSLSSFVIMPLRVDDHQLGFVGFELRWPVEREGYERVSEQLSAVIRSAQMKALGRRYEDTFDSLPRLASRLMNPGDSQYIETRLRDVLEECAARAMEVLKAEPVIVYEWDASAGKFLLDELGPPYSGKIDQRFMRSALEEGDIPVGLIREGKSRFYGTEEFRSVFRAVPEEQYRHGRPPFAIREDIKAMAALILSVGDEIVGVMFVNYREPHEFDRQEKAIHEAFAMCAAIAIRFARMTRDVPRTLHEILGNILGPISNRTREDLATIATLLAEVQALPQPEQLEAVHSTLTMLREYTSWYAEAYAEAILEPVSVTDIALTFRQSAAKTISADGGALGLGIDVRLSTEVENLSVRVSRAHISEIAASLARTASEQGAKHLKVNIASRDALGIEIEISDDGVSFAEPGALFTFDPNRPVPVGRGRTLWWCRTALLKNGAGLALRSGSGRAVSPGQLGNVFVIRLPVAQRPAFEAYSTDRHDEEQSLR